MLLLIPLLSLRKIESNEPFLLSFAQWNWISVMSVCILLTLLLLFCSQLFFKARTQQLPLSTPGTSIFDD
jgi:hypothetical protein